MVALLKMPPPVSFPLPGGTYKHPAMSASVATGKSGAERRVFPRKEISARVESTRIDHSLSALREPHLTLSLRDLSLGGLSAISPTPLQQGERLTFTFPPQGLSDGSLRGGWDAVGRVLRCAPSALGYRIAVEFDALPAAA